MNQIGAGGVVLYTASWGLSIGLTSFCKTSALIPNQLTDISLTYVVRKSPKVNPLVPKLVSLIIRTIN